MWRNYFEINGKKYYTGTVFIVKRLGEQVEASFICYDEVNARYIYKIGICTMLVYDAHFWNAFVSVTNKRDNSAHMPVVKQKRDLNIDGLFIGWVWYIFLMLISCIFKDVIGLWILISFVFFIWRSIKIKEEGKYIEW